MLDIYLILSVLCFVAATHIPTGEKDQKGVILLILKSILYLLSIYCTVIFTLITIDNVLFYFVD